MRRNAGAGFAERSGPPPRRRAPLEAYGGVNGPSPIPADERGGFGKNDASRVENDGGFAYGAQAVNRPKRATERSPASSRGPVASCERFPVKR